MTRRLRPDSSSGTASRATGSSGPPWSATETAIRPPANETSMVNDSLSCRTWCVERLPHRLLHGKDGIVDAKDGRTAGRNRTGGGFKLALVAGERLPPPERGGSGRVGSAESLHVP